MEKRRLSDIVQLQGFDNIVYFSTEVYDVGEFFCLELKPEVDAIYEVYSASREQYTEKKTYYARRIKSQQHG